jgi:hypothetical protein
MLARSVDAFLITESKNLRMVECITSIVAGAWVRTAERFATEDMAIAIEK